MILHLNPSTRDALVRAIDGRRGKLGDRAKTGPLKPHEEADMLILGMVRRDLAAADKADR